MKIDLVCVDDATGEVQFGLAVELPRLYMQAPAGCTYYEVAEPFARADVPSSVRPLFIEGAVQWVETASLEDLRTAKNDEINAAWIVADSTAFEYDGHQFRAGPDDVLRLNCTNGYISLKRQMPPGWIGVWKTMGVDGQPDSYLPLPDIAAWEPFYEAFVMKGLNNYLAAQGLKAQLAAAMTVAEITSIAWPT